MIQKTSCQEFIFLVQDVSFLQSFIRIYFLRSAVLLLPALQGGLQLFYGFSSLAAALLLAVRMAVLPFSQISQKKSERMLLQLPVRQRVFSRRSSLCTTMHL